MKRSALSRNGFTLVELLTVMMVIGILASMVLATVKHSFDQAARKRAEAEIQAMSAALESYKVDNGDYPRTMPEGSGDANKYPDVLDARTAGSTSGYEKQSLVLYCALSGDTTKSRVVTEGARVYFEFRPNMLLPKTKGATTVTALVDPWGYNYGYSTAYSADVKAGNDTPTRGYNPTFDLWSTCNNKTDRLQWKKNW